MTFDDDAEMAAIRAVRIALSESDLAPLRSREIVAVIADMWERHGMEGVSGLVVALARQVAGAIVPLAEYRGVQAAELVDSFEMRKLGQIVDPPGQN